MNLRYFSALLVWVMCPSLVSANYIDTRIDALQCIYDDALNPGSCSDVETKRKSDFIFDSEGIPRNALSDATYVNFTFGYDGTEFIKYDNFDCRSIPSSETERSSDYYKRICQSGTSNITDRSLTTSSYIENGVAQKEGYVNSEFGYLRKEVDATDFSQNKSIANPSEWPDLEMWDFNWKIGSLIESKLKIQNINTNTYTVNYFESMECVKVYKKVNVWYWKSLGWVGSLWRIEIYNDAENLYNLEPNVIEYSSGIVDSHTSDTTYFDGERGYYCLTEGQDTKDIFDQVKVEHTCTVDVDYDPTQNRLNRTFYNCIETEVKRSIEGKLTQIPISVGDITSFVPYVIDADIGAVDLVSGPSGRQGQSGSISQNKEMTGYGYTCGGKYPDLTIYDYPSSDSEEYKKIFQIANQANIKDDDGYIIDVDNNAVNSLIGNCTDGFNLKNTFVTKFGQDIDLDLLDARVTYVQADPLTFWTNVADYFEEQLNYKITELNHYIKLLEGSNDFDPEALKCISAQSMMASLGADFIAYADEPSNGVNIDIWEEFPSVSSCSAYGNGRGWRYQDNPTEIENASWNYATFNEGWTQDPYSASKSLQLIQTADNLDGIVQSPTNKVSELIGEINAMLTPDSSLDQFLTLTRNYAGHLSTESCTDLAEAIVGVGPNQTGGMLSKLVEYQNSNESESNPLSSNIDINFNCP